MVFRARPTTGGRPLIREWADGGASGSGRSARSEARTNGLDAGVVSAYLSQVVALDGRRRSGSEVSTMRRRVDRLTATLMYADRNRMSAIRRKVPLTSFATALPRHSAAGDRSCNGGSPAHRPALGHPACQTRYPSEVLISRSHLSPEEPG